MLDSNPNLTDLDRRVASFDNEHTTEMTVPETLSVLLRYLPLVLALAAAVGVLTFIISSLQTTQFDANGRLELATEVDYYDIDGRRTTARTILENADTERAINEFARSVNTEILNMRVDLPPDSKGIDVNVSATTASGAAAVTNELMRIATDNDDRVREEGIKTERDGLLELNDRLTGEIAEYDVQIADLLTREQTATNAERALLAQQRQDLTRDKNSRADQRNQNNRLIDNLEQRTNNTRANLRVAWEAVEPVDKSRPKPARNAVLGFMLGAMLGSALVMVFFRDRARLGDDERIGVHLAAPVLSETDSSVPSDSLIPAAIAVDRRAKGQRVGIVDVDESGTDQQVYKGLNNLLAQRMTEADRAHWMQVPPGTPGAPWAITCGSLNDPSAIRYLDMVDAAVLLAERGKVTVKQAHAAASKLRALGIEVLGVVVVS